MNINHHEALTLECLECARGLRMSLSTGLEPCDESTSRKKNSFMRFQGALLTSPQFQPPTGTIGCTTLDLPWAKLHHQRGLQAGPGPPAYEAAGSTSSFGWRTGQATHVLKPRWLVDTRCTSLVHHHVDIRIVLTWLNIMMVHQNGSSY